MGIRRNIYYSVLRDWNKEIIYILYIFVWDFLKKKKKKNICKTKELEITFTVLDFLKKKKLLFSFLGWSSLLDIALVRVLRCFFDNLGWLRMVCTISSYFFLLATSKAVSLCCKQASVCYYVILFIEVWHLVHLNIKMKIGNS